MLSYIFMKYINDQYKINILFSIKLDIRLADAFSNTFH